MLFKGEVYVPLLLEDEDGRAANRAAYQATEDASATCT